MSIETDLYLRQIVNINIYGDELFQFGIITSTQGADIDSVFSVIRWGIVSCIVA